MFARVQSGKIVATETAVPAAVQVTVDEPVFEWRDVEEDGETVSRYVDTGRVRSVETWMSGADSLADEELAAHGWHRVTDDGVDYDPATQTVEMPTVVVRDGVPVAVYKVTDRTVDELKTAAIAAADADLDRELEQARRDALDAFLDGNPAPPEVVQRRATALAAHADTVREVKARRKADFGGTPERFGPVF